MTKFLTLLLKVIITLPVIGYLFFVTLENRGGNLDFVWSPFHDVVSIPLPLILFLGLVAGFVWGSVIMWSNTLYLRSDKREMKKKIASLEHQLELQKREAERLVKPALVQSAHTTTTAPRIAAPEVL